MLLWEIIWLGVLFLGLNADGRKLAPCTNIIILRNHKGAIVLSMRKEDRVLFMREEDRQSRILSLDEQSFDRVTSQVHNFRAAHTDSWLIFGSSSQHFAHVFLTDAFLIILDCVKVLSLYPSVLLTFVSISDDVVTLPAAFDLISGLPNRRYLLFPAHDL